MSLLWTSLANCPEQSLQQSRRLGQWLKPASACSREWLADSNASLAGRQGCSVVGPLPRQCICAGMRRGACKCAGYVRCSMQHAYHLAWHNSPRHARACQPRGAAPGAWPYLSKCHLPKCCYLGTDGGRAHAKPHDNFHTSSDAPTVCSAAFQNRAVLQACSPLGRWPTWAQATIRRLPWTAAWGVGPASCRCPHWSRRGAGRVPQPPRTPCPTQT
jgi:hypothetical protein